MIVVVTVTYYADTSDVRFGLALELCKLAASKQLLTIIVDDSPDHQTIRSSFERAGESYVKVFQQDSATYHGKGGALRQAIQLAKDLVGEDKASNSVICFAEPEKVDIMNHMQQIVEPILAKNADIVVPMRCDELFRKTYPIEQYHSESFANLHFNSLAQQFEEFQTPGAKQIDWLFGPFSFNTTLADAWLKYEGTSWDAQMVPYVRAVRQQKKRITSVTINFLHPHQMKEQEEGDTRWTKKRLHQLNILFDILGEKEFKT
jgi:hypothetical protein